MRQETCFVSTRARPGDARAPLSTAVFESLAPSGGLYMPSDLAPLPTGFWRNWPDRPLTEYAADILAPLLGSAITHTDLNHICREAFDFPVVITPLKDSIHLVELFHGPTLAFKDFGARFMAQLIAHLAKSTNRSQTTILVATSGDTGGAVASAFHRVPNVRVVILYPKGGVSKLQEKQLTTHGDNISALCVDGSFDDCQYMAKSTFADHALSTRHGLASANSINLARLLPQTLYYFEAARLLARSETQTAAADTSLAPVFVVPSGNFGNLTAGILAQRLGLPVHQWVAATNRNDTVPTFLAGAPYQPRPSVPTLSNAMDVGAPNNFERIRHLFQNNETAIRQAIHGFAFDDPSTLEAIQRLHRECGTIVDPHTAVGCLAAEQTRANHPSHPILILATAHPAKFPETIHTALGHSHLSTPDRLAKLTLLPGQSTPIAPPPAALASWLHQNS